MHGALCIAYSGQCLTSEAIGGRSANRGACAQACRLPYDLVVDGEPRDLGDRAYLLSPEDLEASRAGAAAGRAGGLLAEDRGPAQGAGLRRGHHAALPRGGRGGAWARARRRRRAARQTALQMYSRGSGPGFLAGVDHQRLVDGRTCEHRGLPVGSATRRGQAPGRAATCGSRLTTPVARGDGVVVDGGREGAGEIGGRVWDRACAGARSSGARRAARPGCGWGPTWRSAAARATPGRGRCTAPRIRRPTRAVRAALAPAGDRARWTCGSRGQAGAPAVIEARTAPRPRRRGRHRRAAGRRPRAAS